MAATKNKIPDWKKEKITTYFRNNPNKTMLEIGMKFTLSKSAVSKVISDYYAKKQAN